MSGFEGKKILIVEDDDDLQLLYSLYLQGQNFSVTQARNGQEGFECIDKETPDLIILDMIMPIMDGEEFFTKLRTERKLDIPVIIASVNDKIPQKIFDLGNVYTNLKKPFTVEVLIENIKGALTGLPSK